MDGNKETEKLSLNSMMSHSFCPFFLLPFSSPSFPPLFLLCGTPIGQTTCCSWRRFTDGECDWMVRLLTSACSRGWTLAWRHTEHKAGFYTPCGHTAKSAFKHIFLPVFTLFPCSPSSERAFSKTASLSIEVRSFLAPCFFVCGWLAICLEMNSLPGFPGHWMRVKKCEVS